MRGKGDGGGAVKNGLLPNSLRIISSCLRTVSTNAGSVASSVRFAGASVASSIGATPAEDIKDEVLWVGFDRLDFDSSFKHVLLLGYSNGFQVLDVEDASDVRELVSKRDGPVTFLQMQPNPAKSEGPEGFRLSHPMLLVVAADETKGSGTIQGGRLSALIKDGCTESRQGTSAPTPTVVRFFSLKSNSIVHVLRFRSVVYVVRCSPRVVAVGLAAQIYCFDADTLENKFSVLTYPIQGAIGANVGYGPMALGSRWLAYASNNPLLSTTGRLSPQNLTPSPGVSPSTSPSSGSLVARYAMESSKQLAVGIINLGDMGYKTLSKYCQELLPDGSSSPVSSNLGRKNGKISSSAHQSEADNAGMVVVKDLVSKDVISQFRAHTSPISALCFDSTGTLLVTASIHGNNINVLRILPSSVPNGSNSARYDWNSSHIHLYKLYRGLTTAVIQDISFSQDSRWISIISSRGTCHIYVISPFGGDAGFRSQNLHDGGPSLAPALSFPWWSSSSCVIDHEFVSPPPPITLSVVSRIKNGNSGWLNSVTTVAASAAGKLHAPSGAVAAIFHNSIHGNLRKINSKTYPMEQLLVYSPSGHVIQYELHPSLSESCHSTSSSGTTPIPLLQIQDEELRVSAEPMQWWDVCRRLNWPERDECVSVVVLDAHNTSEMLVETSACEEKNTNCSASSTSAISGKTTVFERPNWYLSNAEVRGNNRRMPIWQKTKISFYMINPSMDNWGLRGHSSGGEIEIEKLTVQEVEIRQKDPLPVFQHFHGVQLNWHDRIHGRGTEAGSLKGIQNTVKCTEDMVIRGSFASNHCSEPLKINGSISQPENTAIGGHPQNTDMLHPFGEAVDEGRGSYAPAISPIKPDALITSEGSCQDNKTIQSRSASGSNSPMADYVTGDFSSGNRFSSMGNRCSSMDGHKNHMQNDVSGDVALSDANIQCLQKLEFPDSIQEEYCKLSELDDCQDSTEPVTDADSNSSLSERGKSEGDDEENDDMLGGVFAFSKEG